MIRVALRLGLLATLLGTVACDAPLPREAPGLVETRDALRPLQETLPPPGPSDWLAQHEEPGQTLEEYLRSKPIRADERRRVLYLIRIGKITEAQATLLDAAAEGLGLAYGLPVRWLDPFLALEEFPGHARRERGVGGQQLHSTYLLDEFLVPRLPDDAAVLLALTAIDLWPGRGWNFVFGQASLGRRVGVWSIARYGDPSESEASWRLALDRTLKTAWHETGHMFSIVHCTAHDCVMNGSNHLAESDARAPWFCAECLPKVRFATGVDLIERAREVAEFSERHGLERLARHSKAVMERLAER